MGCWNGTCGLSGLPIFCGDPVVAMVIQQSGISELTPSYPWQRWSPASLLVHSSYDDYGGLDLTPLVIEALKCTQDAAALVMRKIPVGDSFGYGYVRGDTFHIEEGDDQNFSLFRQPDDSGFALWMAHESILLDLVAKAKMSDSNWKLRPIVDVVTEEVAANIKCDAEKRLIPHTERGIDFENGWEKSGCGFKGAAVRFITEEIRNYTSPEQYEQYLAATEFWTDLWSLYNVMSVLRMTLHPTGACGSQDGDLQPYRVLFDSAKRQIVKQARKYD